MAHKNATRTNKLDITWRIKMLMRTLSLTKANKNASGDNQINITRRIKTLLGTKIENKSNSKLCYTHN